MELQLSDFLKHQWSRSGTWMRIPSCLTMMRPAAEILLVESDSNQERLTHVQPVFNPSGKLWLVMRVIVSIMKRSAKCFWSRRVMELMPHPLLCRSFDIVTCTVSFDYLCKPLEAGMWTSFFRWLARELHWSAWMILDAATCVGPLYT